MGPTYGGGSSSSNNEDDNITDSKIYMVILNNFYEDGSIVEIIYTKMIATKNEDYEFLRGPQGHTPYIGENGNWWINGEDTGVFAGYAPVVMTQAEYDALTEIDEDTLYYIKEE